jgi:hypothetical protein
VPHPPRLQRILLNTATATSLALLLLALLLWFRGRWVHDKFVWTTPAGRMVMVTLFHRGIGVNVIIDRWPSAQPLQWLEEGRYQTRGPVFHLTNRQAAARTERQGFGIYTQSGHGHTHRAADGTVLWYTSDGGGFADSSSFCDRLPPLAYRFVSVNYLIPVVAFGVLPSSRGMIAAWRSVRQRRRMRHGQCPTCGYDCRATPERCPECGSEIAR